MHLLCVSSVLKGTVSSYLLLLIANATNSLVEVSICAHSEVCKWIDCVTQNTGTRLLYTAFGSSVKSFMQLIAMQLEKKGKFEIFH